MNWGNIYFVIGGKGDDAQKELLFGILLCNSQRGTDYVC